MAKDHLNVIERALMMGISDQINGATATDNDVHVYGQFPETEDLRFPDSNSPITYATLLFW